MEETKNSMIDNYIQYVLTKINEMEEYCSNIRKPDVSLYELKELTSNRLHINFILQSEYQRLKITYKNEVEDFKVWWSDIFTDVRKELNPPSLAGNKYASKADIEATVIQKHKEDYLERKESLNYLESQMEFMRRLLEDWRSVQTDISSLLRLLELESRESGFSNILNSNRTKLNDNNNVVTEQPRQRGIPSQL